MAAYNSNAENEKTETLEQAGQPDQPIGEHHGQLRDPESVNKMKIN